MPTTFFKLGILGWPLGYSLSPLMHQAALKAAGLKGEYREYPVEPDPTDAGSYERIANWLYDVRDNRKLDGLNVTMPYKPQAAAWCLSKGNSIDRVARDIDAVNTIRFENGSAVGYNTDGVGFLQPLRDRGIDLSDRRLLLLGAGGAAKAIAITLALEREVQLLVIWNRHPERAETLMGRANIVYYGSPGKTGFAKAIREIAPSLIREIDFLVNATPMGMSGEGEVPQEVLGQLHKGQLVYDIVYEPRETALIQAARRRGCPVITGEEMLAGQAAASFELWTGVKGMLPVMRKALEEHFAGR